MVEYINKQKAINKLPDRQTIELIRDMEPADVVEREKVVEDMKTLHDEIYHLVKTENWDKEREIESKIITQALDVINGYIENYTKE